MPKDHLKILRAIAKLEQPWQVTGDMDEWPAIDEFEARGLIEGRRLKGHGVGKQIIVLRLAGEGIERIRELERTETTIGIIKGNRWKIYAAIAGAIGTVATGYLLYLLKK